MSEATSARLARIANAHGSFPDEPTVLAMFDQVLTVANEEADTAVAATILDLIDRHSEVARAMPADLAERVCDWAGPALTRTDPPAELIARILVAAGSERSLALLRELAGRTDAPGEAARRFVVDHRLYRAGN
jgi:hypothetical protein